MIREDSDETKRSHWTELEIRGPIRNLSPELWTFTHLTALFLNDNNLQVNVIREGGRTRGEREGGREEERREAGLSLPSGLLLFFSLLSPFLLSPSSLRFFSLPPHSVSSLPLLTPFLLSPSSLCFFSVPLLLSPFSLFFPPFQPPFHHASVWRLLVHVLKRVTTRKPCN